MVSNKGIFGEGVMNKLQYTDGKHSVKGAVLEKWSQTRVSLAKGLCPLHFQRHGLKSGATSPKLPWPQESGKGSNLLEEYF